MLITGSRGSRREQEKAAGRLCVSRGFLSPSCFSRITQRQLHLVTISYKCLAEQLKFIANYLLLLT